MRCLNTSFIYDTHRQGAFVLVGSCIRWNSGTIIRGLFAFFLYDFGAHRISVILSSSRLANRWHFGIFYFSKIIYLRCFLVICRGVLFE